MNEKYRTDIEKYIKDFPIWTEQMYNMTRNFLPYIPENGILFDIGANLGLLCKEFMKVRKINIHMFEPIPYLYEYCMETITPNDSIIIENKAVTDVTGYSEIYANKYIFGSNTLLKSIADGFGDMMEKIKIETISIDDYVQSKQIKRIDGIKIDVEGSEYKVIRGMHKTIETLERKPFIICEIADKKVHSAWNEEIEEIEWLFAHGYQRVEYDYDKVLDITFKPIGM